MIVRLAMILVAAFLAASPTLAVAGSVLDDVANREAALKDAYMAIAQSQSKLVDLLEKMSKVIVRSVRANGCRKIDIERFTNLSKKLSDMQIDALSEAKKAMETRQSMSEAEFAREYQGSLLFANRVTTALGWARLDFADAALDRHCTDLANIVYRAVYAYGPSDLSRRAELGLRDVDAQRSKSK